MCALEQRREYADRINIYAASRSIHSWVTVLFTCIICHNMNTFINSTKLKRINFSICLCNCYLFIFTNTLMINFACSHVITNPLISNVNPASKVDPTVVSVLSFSPGTSAWTLLHVIMLSRVMMQYRDECKNRGVSQMYFLGCEERTLRSAQRPEKAQRGAQAILNLFCGCLGECLEKCCLLRWIFSLSQRRLYRKSP